MNAGLKHQSRIFQAMNHAAQYDSRSRQQEKVFIVRIVLNTTACECKQHEEAPNPHIAFDLTLGY